LEDLLEIAPVSVTETCFHRGAEGELESQSERGDMAEERKGLLQMYCCGSALSTSLAGFGDFFLGC